MTQPMPDLPHRLAFGLLTAAFIASGLDAYLLFNVPFIWLSYLFALMALPFLRSAEVNYTGIAPYLAFLLWAVVATGIGISNLEEPLEPADLVFIGIRFARLLCFICVLFIAIKFMQTRRDVSAFTLVVIGVGTVFALVAMYFYHAQLNGLPEINRNRAGTSGDDWVQVPVFTYPFHRLLGTFREPGLYIEWILLPFFLAIQHSWRSRIIMVCAGVMLGSIFLTGSLLGLLIVMATAGLAMTGWALGTRKSINYRCFGAFLVGVGIFALGVKGMPYTHGYRISDTSQLHAGQLIMLVVEDRLLPLAQSGMKAESRAYIQEATKDFKISLSGEGVGISNLQLGRLLESDEPGSFLNLYLNTLTSTGIVGLLLLGGALVFPLLQREGTRPRLLYLKNHAIWMAALYGAYLMTFYSTIEELTFGFAMATALILQVARTATGPLLNANSSEGS